MPLTSTFQKFIKGLSGKHVLLLVHKAADVDCIASAAVLKNSLNNVQFTIGVPGYLNQHALRLSESMKIKHTLNPVISDFAAVIVLDFNTPEMLGLQAAELEKFKKPVFIIDHHSKTKDSLDFPNKSIIDSNAVSTTQIVFQILQELKIKVSSGNAILLSAGIITDSNGLAIADSKTLQTLASLLKVCGKTVSEVQAVYEIPQDVSERIASLKSAKRVMLFKAGDFLIALSQVSHFASNAANSLISLGADLAIVGFSDDDGNAKLNARASESFLKKTGVNLEKDILSKLERKFEGTSGGHEGAAGFSGIARIDELFQESMLLIEEFLGSKGLREKIKELKD